MDRTRNGLVDTLRFASAIVIVCFHARVIGPEMVAVAMAIFTLFLTYFSARNPRARSLAEVTSVRASRLLKPFVFWAALSVFLIAADALNKGIPIDTDLKAWFPPQGTFAQLWFLPFAFGLTMVIELGTRITDSRPGHVTSLGLAAVGSVLWMPFWSYLALPNGLEVFGAYLPSVFFALALAARPDRKEWALTVIAASIFCAGLLEWMGFEAAFQLGLGVPLAVYAVTFAGPTSHRSRWMSGISMPIYLTHTIVLAVLVHSTRLGSGSILLALLTILGAIFLSMCLLSTRIGREVV